MEYIYIYIYTKKQHLVLLMIQLHNYLISFMTLDVFSAALSDGPRAPSEDALALDGRGQGSPGGLLKARAPDPWRLLDLHCPPLSLN